MTAGPISQSTDATANWLLAALAAGGVNLPQGAITNVRTEPLGAGRGNLSSVVRLRFDVDAAAPLFPTSLVLKFAPSDASPLVRTWRFGRRESLFYRTFGGNVPIRIPRCYYADFHDPSGNFTLLLEDLGQAAIADQEVGASREQAELAVTELAHLHAHFWQHECLDSNASWLNLPNANREAFEFFVKRAWRALAESHPLLPTSSTQALHDLERVYGACLDRVSTPPLTLLHGDCRLENMFFRSGAWEEPFTIADWQLVCRGRGAWDVANFVVGSLTEESRAEIGSELLARYHQVIAETTGGTYSFDECVADYHASVIGSFSLAAVIADTQRRSLGRPGRVVESWLRRASRGVVEALAAL